MRIHRLLAIGDIRDPNGLLAATLDVLAAAAARAGGFSLAIDQMSEDGFDPAARRDDATTWANAGAILMAPGSAGGRLARRHLVEDLGFIVTVRPIRASKHWPGPLSMASPSHLDWLIVGAIAAGRRPGQDEPGPASGGLLASDDGPASPRARSEAALRHAYQMARSRLRKRLTVITAPSWADPALATWGVVASKVAEGYPDVVVDHVTLQTLSLRMSHHPETLDVIATSGLDTDVVSAWAAALAGPPGVFPSASFNPARHSPALFEPLQSSALAIEDEGVLQPIGAFWAVAMILKDFGEERAAALVMEAIETVCGALALETEWRDTVALRDAVVAAIRSPTV